MEALTPIQRVAVIAIGLALTLIVAALALPWISKQIEKNLPSTGTPVPWNSPRTPAGPQSSSSIPAIHRTSVPAATLPLVRDTTRYQACFAVNIIPLLKDERALTFGARS